MLNRITPEKAVSETYISKKVCIFCISREVLLDYTNLSLSKIVLSMGDNTKPTINQNENKMKREKTKKQTFVHNGWTDEAEIIL